MKIKRMGIRLKSRPSVFCLVLILTVVVSSYLYTDKLKQIVRYPLSWNVVNILAVDKSKPLLVLGILSKSSHMEHRNVHRKTWIQWAKTGLPLHVTVRFLIDRPTDELTVEANQYGDIFFLNTNYSGYAIKYAEKMHIWFTFVAREFPAASLVGKMDDDVFLCTPQLFNRLNNCLDNKLYYGWKHDKHSGKNIRMDGMFVVIGNVLLKRLMGRRFCYKDHFAFCNERVDLVGTDFGGLSLASWLSIYPDVKVISDRGRLVHTSLKEKLAQLITPNFCNNHLLLHKLPLADLIKMYSFHQN